FTIIRACPDMLICAGIDQLRADPHLSASALHAAFQDVRHSKLLSYLTQVSWIANLVDHYRRATDHFQVGNLSEISQNLVLHAIGKKSVFFFVTQILEWQHRDALFGN